MIGIHTRITTGGPLFDGETRRAIDDFTEAWEDETAEQALRHIRTTHSRSFKNPSGYYQSLVHIDRVGGSPRVVDDGQIEYGPWLEGVGSRNSTTRFKGYHAFRRAAQYLERRADEIGEHLLHRRYLRRMN